MLDKEVLKELKKLIDEDAFHEVCSLIESIIVENLTSFKYWELTKNRQVIDVPMSNREAKEAVEDYLEEVRC